MPTLTYQRRVIVAAGSVAYSFWAASLAGSQPLGKQVFETVYTPLGAARWLRATRPKRGAVSFAGALPSPVRLYPVIAIGNLLGDRRCNCHERRGMPWSEADTPSANLLYQRSERMTLRGLRDAGRV